MPRKKHIPPTEDARLYAEDLAEFDPSLGRELEPANARSGLEGGNSNLRISRRDSFDEGASKLLEKVLSELEEILDDPDARKRDKISASKVILQTQGLLEKRQGLDADSVVTLIAELTRRSPVRIRDVIPEDAPTESIK